MARMKRTLEILDLKKTDAVSPEAVFRAVCLDVSESTRANRVSIWRFENRCENIYCVSFYEAEKNKFSSGQKLFARDHPNYFESIQIEKFIVASDALNDPATADLSGSYFQRHDIYSLLDFILYENFNPVGVICCENAGKRLDWTDDDVSYLRQISTLISHFFKFDSEP